ncbi:hypothetical protein 13AC503A_gene0005 [Aeromonas phage 13AC503A]|nr:hypothetical protein 13AC503A_gene0005 [Aeromonas phage 13AC503A]
MSITVEQYFAKNLENQEKIISLLEQIAGGADNKAAAGKTTTGKGAAAGKTTSKNTSKAPKITKSQAADAVNKVKDTLGVDAAKAIMAECGVGKLASMTEDQIEPIYNAAMEALAGADEQEEQEEDL